MKTIEQDSFLIFFSPTRKNSITTENDIVTIPVIECEKFSLLANPNKMMIWKKLEH